MWYTDRHDEVLARGAEAHGFVGDVWTTARVGVVIRREYGVRYHPAHVSQREEAAIQAWHEERRAALEGKPGRRSAHSWR